MTKNNYLQNVEKKNKINKDKLFTSSIKEDKIICLMIKNKLVCIKEVRKE